MGIKYAVLVCYPGHHSQKLSILLYSVTMLFMECERFLEIWIGVSLSLRLFLHCILFLCPGIGWVSAFFATCILSNLCAFILAGHRNVPSIFFPSHLGGEAVILCVVLPPNFFSGLGSILGSLVWRGHLLLGSPLSSHLLDEPCLSFLAHVWWIFVHHTVNLLLVFKSLVILYAHTVSETFLKKIECCVMFVFLTQWQVWSTDCRINVFGIFKSGLSQLSVQVHF